MLLSADTVERILLLGLRRHRGRRAGRSVQSKRSTPHLRPLSNGAFAIVGNRPTRKPTPVAKPSQRCVVSIPVPRCAEAVGRALTFGSMNVRSLSPSKLDNLLDVIRDRHLDVLLLCETWHDADSVSIRRLRADGFAVVERARPRSRDAETSLGVNHGGVAVIAAAGIRVSAVDLGILPTTFECVIAPVSYTHLTLPTIYSV